MNSILFITTASWEPRFLDGARRILKEGHATAVLCFWFDDYSERTTEARALFAKEFDGMQPVFRKLRLVPHADETGNSPSSSRADVWRGIFEAFSEVIIGKERFILDITTTPREALWIILDLLTEAGLPGEIVYHRAESHGDWCGGEPERPHIVPKLGGISEIDKSTKLFVLTGFDQDRCEHFISYFEPQSTVIALQIGSPKEDVPKNQMQHIAKFSGRHGIELIEMNSYSDDWGFNFIAAATADMRKDSNLVLASLGPKTSAVALYRLHRTIVNSALVYSPCREYNPNYSQGIKETLRLNWNPQEVTGNSG